MMARGSQTRSCYYLNGDQEGHRLCQWVETSLLLGGSVTSISSGAGMMFWAGTKVRYNNSRQC